MRCPECREYLPDIEVAKFCPTCGALLGERLSDPLIEKLIGDRFKIKELVAEGGMGRIYAAQQVMGAGTRKVAIKMLLAEYAAKPQDVTRFMRECSTVCELEHPNTIKFYDYGQTAEGDLYIAMEFLAGDTLGQALKNDGAFPPERVDWIVSQIAGSLQEAHDKGFIHRDLKPDNILLTNPAGELDTVKVLDFGIAKRSGSSDQKLTPLGVVLGSPPYMSPEQFSLQDIDARSDIYSLGVLAYQALTGKLPFRAKDMLQWAALHMTAPPRPFETTEVGVAVPDSMRDACLKALAKDPKDRPQTMREFYEIFTIGMGKSMLPGRPSRQSGLARSSGRVEPLPPPPDELKSPPVPPDLELDVGRSPIGIQDGDDSAHEPADAEASDTEDEIPQFGASGTLRLKSSAPPPDGPAEPVVVPELLPPTLRDPVPPISRGGVSVQFGKIIVIGFGALVVAGAMVLGGIALNRDDESETDETKNEPDPPTTETADPPAVSASPFLIPSLLPTAFPTQAPTVASTAGPDAPVDPCEQSIVSAINGDCTRALQLKAQCGAEHPDHALAHRAFNRRCQPQP